MVLFTHVVKYVKKIKGTVNKIDFRGTCEQTLSHNMFAICVNAFN